jgi:hypothetical protein
LADFRERFGSQPFAMKNSTLYLFLAAVLLSIQVQAHTQSLTSSTKKGSPAQEQAPCEFELGSKVAEVEGQVGLCGFALECELWSDSTRRMHSVDDDWRCVVRNCLEC